MSALYKNQNFSRKVVRSGIRSILSVGLFYLNRVKNFSAGVESSLGPMRKSLVWREMLSLISLAVVSLQQCDNSPDFSVASSKQGSG